MSQQSKKKHLLLIRVLIRGFLGEILSKNLRSMNPPHQEV